MDFNVKMQRQDATPAATSFVGIRFELVRTKLVLLAEDGNPYDAFGDFTTQFLYEPIIETSPK